MAIAHGCTGNDDKVIYVYDRGPRDDYHSVDVADMNDDGFPDLVAAGFTIINNNDRSSHISVFLQNTGSPGTFEPPRNYAYSPVEISPTEIEVVDIQGDGLPDVIASGFSELGFRILLNDASAPGVLLPSNHYGPIEVYPVDGWPQLTAADVNGDLLTDVLTADAYWLTYYPQSNSNPGTFLAGVRIGKGYDVPAAADMNNDSYTDVITFLPDGDSLLYYQQDSTAPGQFLAPLRLKLDFWGAAIGIADLNDDGLKDFVISGEEWHDWGDSSGVLAIYHQTAPGTFQRVERHGTSSNYLEERLALADLDGDGNIEIILGQQTHNRPNTIEIYSQDALGEYSSNQILRIPDDRIVTYQQLYAVRVADLNNDTLLDIAVSTNEIFVFFAQPGQPGIYDSPTRITAQR